jgi:hypothetical protein
MSGAPAQFERHLLGKTASNADDAILSAFTTAMISDWFVF